MPRDDGGMTSQPKVDGCCLTKSCIYVKSLSNLPTIGIRYREDAKDTKNSDNLISQPYRIRVSDRENTST